MPSVSMTSLIEAVKAFAHKHDITDDQISDIYICCHHYDKFANKYVECVINACIVRYNDDESLMVYVGFNDDFKNVLVFESFEERERVINEYCGDRPYVCSVVKQKAVVDNIDPSVDHLILRAGPTKVSFHKKRDQPMQPDFRRSPLISWLNETQHVEYYKLSIFQQK